jgi:AcrR family transcriptional regulator
MSLRERKKEQTRQRIGEAAHQLFVERGFDAVTVADVARAADVSEGTVFNYFPTKEDLFYSQMEAFEEALLDAVRNREAGESVLEAFRKLLVDRGRRLADEDRPDLIATAARVVNESPALQAREREIVDRYTHELAALIAEETGARDGDVVPKVVANALMGTQRELRAYVWARVLDGLRGPELAADVRKQANRAFARLERGLADYAVKRRR